MVYHVLEVFYIQTGTAKIFISDLSDYCLRIPSQRFSYKLLSENSFQTILKNCYQRNHCNYLSLHDANMNKLDRTLCLHKKCICSIFFFKCLVPIK